VSENEKRREILFLNIEKILEKAMRMIYNITNCQNWMTGRFFEIQSNK
jgi:hypothetical protein